MRAIAKFLILTFAITWALWAIVLGAASAHAQSAASPALSLGGPVFLLGVFAPGLVALALSSTTDARERPAALLGRALRWRVDVRYYAFALLLMPAVKLATAVIYRALTGSWPQFGETHPVLLLAATILGTVGQAGEELGWRGYLLPRVAELAGLRAASVIVGAVWAVWHLPLFFAAGADTDHQSFLLYALQLMAYSVALAWLYWRTNGSVLLAMIMHSAFNNMKDIVPSRAAPVDDVFTLGGSLVFRLTVMLLWIVGACLLLRMRGSLFRPSTR